MFAYDGGWKYEVSNLGEVRRAGYWGYKRRRYHEPYVLKQQVDRNGRMKVTLQEAGVAHTCHVSRIVALSFVDNPSNATQVIHIDGNIKNNKADNLVWSNSTSRTPYVLSMSKAVRQYTLDGEFLAEYKSACVIQRLFGYDHSTISDCCRRKKRHNTGYGYIWRFACDDEFRRVDCE